MKIPITFFAPAERESLEVVHRQASGLNQTAMARTLSRASVNYMFVLNSRRQIVMASENVLDLVPARTMDQIVGLRPGEALGCIHASECEGGCGTSRFCSQCGSVRVILSGLKGCRAMEKCRLTRIINGRVEPLHLQVLATPLVYNRQRFTLLTVANVGDDQE